MKFLIILSIASCISCFSFSSFAAEVHENANASQEKPCQSDFDIIKKILGKTNYGLAKESLEIASEAFLGKVYKGDALGEGTVGDFDKDPLYRFDEFDCMTYVETSLALSRAQSIGEFEKLINEIRYKKGLVDYKNRNHFVEADWIKNNTKNGIIKDVTKNISFGSGLELKIATASIDKNGWYKNSKNEKLRSVVVNEPIQKVSLPYIPAKAFANDESTIDNIPSGAIISFIRPDWKKMKEAGGTEMIVSHMGIVVRKDDGILYFRHASSNEKKVVEVPFEDMCKKISEKSDKPNSVAGFNITMPQK